MKKIMVTGAAGVIGWELARTLADSGHEVIAFNRRVPEHLQHDNVTWALGDLLQKDSLLKAMTGCEEVYHVAAVAKLHTLDPQEHFKTNVEGTTHVLRAAQELGIRRVCYTSTGGVLGPNKGQLLTEDDIMDSNFDNSYDQSKYLGEQQVHQFVQQGLDAVIVNVTRIFGPSQMRFSNANTKMIKDYLSKSFVLLPGDGHAIGNYGYITDIVNGHIQAMAKGHTDQRYILGGENISYHQFLDEAEKLTGKRTRRICLPRWGMYAFAKSEMILSKMQGKAPRIATGDVNRLINSRRMSIAKAQDHLNYSVTPLAKAMAETISFLGY